MTVPPEADAEIKRLFHAEHWKIGTIAAHLGLHHDAIRRVLAILPGQSLTARAPRPMRIDPYREFVAEQLKRYPRLRSTRLHDMLKERGYTGSVRTIRRFVAQVRPAPSSEVYLRLPEPLPGEQAQCDWAHVGPVAVPGGERSLWLFVMILSYSRALWAEFVFELTADSLRRSLVRAVGYFGGCTRQWLFDYVPGNIIEVMCPAPICGAGRPRLFCGSHYPQSRAHNAGAGSMMISSLERRLSCWRRFTSGPTRSIGYEPHGSARLWSDTFHGLRSAGIRLVASCAASRF